MSKFNKELVLKATKLLKLDRKRIDTILISVAENFDFKFIGKKRAVICNLTIELHNLFVDHNYKDDDILHQVATSLNYEEIAELAEYYYKTITNRKIKNYS